MENKSALLIQGEYCSGSQYPLGNTVRGNRNTGNRMRPVYEVKSEYSSHEQSDYFLTNESAID